MTEKVLLGAFTAVEGAHAYSAFCPSIFTIRTFREQPETVRSIRDGEILGSLFVLALGAVVSALVHDATPMYFAIATVAIMVTVYEWALRS